MLKRSGADQTMIELPEDWCPPIIVPGVSFYQQGIYERHVDDDFYIGSATSFPTGGRRYRNNVIRIFKGMPYHISGKDYRLVHYALAEGVLAGRRIQWRLIESVAGTGANLFARQD